MLLMLSLTCLVSIAMLNVLFGSQIVDGVIDTTQQSGEILENSTSVDTAAVEVTFNLNATEGAITMILTIIVVASIVGIRIFSSGLSDSSVSMITKLIAFLGIWAVFSVLAYDLLISIAFVGYLIWLTLTILYTIGVIKQFTGGG